MNEFWSWFVANDMARLEARDTGVRQRVRQVKADPEPEFGWTDKWRVEPVEVESCS